MIEVKNLSGSRIEQKSLLKATQKVLTGEKSKLDVSIVLMQPKEIQLLNRQYRNKNYPTDVLSFRYEESGEIVLCVQEIKKDAMATGTILKKQVVLVLIHGVLHLLGYDHEKSRKEAEKMEKKQNYYLKKLRFN
ncbi:MAG: rRNA maturation RNase YbeY [Candidatus Wildermuthbacteria bacterium RIFCSPLOWO2_12_FULL_40_9]|uniref:Endoribonuclease YbeY n=2 Tax=Candidatus Wildermuthiibacteriota TaxID=1817923 RepID=A0A1G2RE89_9BACT|nr:MAG: rRNA maturation RNase YbeY [Candidatus Wildermuthbacteria bacterium RIFCSPHIGHO2_12_FULL_40_12]OHA76213.1 MAG: rRNA maturation RNase YbeY [Candidatus Wildermuthbacteria bacterium RIFCSPLOWO2_12_FULL_40_9]